ncbi:MAG TPA: diacylglycerol kinase [Clostridiales bacterium]|nr:MAG: diacylglycerol kinase [Clostridiales bacterium GWD2_32_59]HAN10149.1 diacylglycerol kinase [Clostridiales bacterium]
MKNKSLFDSFNNALLGVVRAIRTERNLRIHLISSLIVLVLALFFNFSTTELLILIFTLALVICMELVNTSIECVVDLVCGKSRHALAKKAKDVAAGAVFVATLCAVLVGYVLFYTKIAKHSINLFQKISQMNYYITLIAILIVLVLTVGIKAFTGYTRFLRGGMPSGHSSISFAIATAICFVDKGKSVLVISLAYFLAFLVAQSRVEGKIHSILQVIAGAALGTLVTVLIFQVFS